jgi:hypothetical protein
MFNEKKFMFDVENLKTDFAIENMGLTDQDINNLREYSNKNISINDMIKKIKLDSNEN